MPGAYSSWWGGTLLEIEPETPYPGNYGTVVDQAKKEIREGYHPPLKAHAGIPDGCEVVLVGSPNWWSTLAPPMATFLAEESFAGKKVLPFCTHGGGGLGSIGRDVAALCPGADVAKAFGVYGGESDDARLTAWLREAGLTLQV